MAPLNQADLLLKTETDDNDQYITTFKAKIAYQKQLFITYVNSQMTYEDFQKEVREVCCISLESPFTIKWIDGDGDPCTISTQLELTEAFRLCNRNKSEELSLQTFLGAPVLPGMACNGETLDMYRKGARRWKKTYKTKGHTFVAKRLHRNAICSYCGDRIWGLGRQGLRCESCPLLVHKKCHKFTVLDCGPNILSLLQSASSKSSDDSAKLCASTREASSYNEEAGNIENSANTGNHIELSTKNGQVIKSSINEEVADIVIGKTRPISIDDFDLIRVIGRGNFAKVLMAELKSTGKIYALKVVKKESMLEDEDNDWVQVEKNVFEICSNHPFLVGLHSCFQSPSRLFYAIEFVQGGDLLNLMNNRRKLPETDARFYTAELCLALNFLHSNGIIYRDLKLDNVLLAHDGHIKLTDYGMCKQGIKLGEKASTFCGTPLYMAPEILNSEDYSFSVDWWALGIILYEMLVGRNPWDSDEIRDEEHIFQCILTKNIRPPRSLSVRAGKAIRGFLNKNPNERLGCDSDHGFQEITNHPFFYLLDWEALEQKQTEPPYLPKTDNKHDFKHFSDEFITEPVEFTPDNENIINNIDQSEYRGFEYVNPLLMTSEDLV